MVIFKVLALKVYTLIINAEFRTCCFTSLVVMKQLCMVCNCAELRCTVQEVGFVLCNHFSSCLWLHFQE